MTAPATGSSSGGSKSARKTAGSARTAMRWSPERSTWATSGRASPGYGVQRGNSEAIAKYTYEKIYNAWAYFPCSNMPRLGATGHLTPEQITHLVAYLIDPQSPLNTK